MYMCDYVSKHRRKSRAFVHCITCSQTKSLACPQKFMIWPRKKTLSSNLNQDEDVVETKKLLTCLCWVTLSRIWSSRYIKDAFEISTEHEILEISDTVFQFVTGFFKKDQKSRVNGGIWTLAYWFLVLIFTNFISFHSLAMCTISNTSFPGWLLHRSRAETMKVYLLEFCVSRHVGCRWRCCRQAESVWMLISMKQVI